MIYRKRWLSWKDKLRKKIDIVLNIFILNYSISESTKLIKICERVLLLIQSTERKILNCTIEVSEYSLQLEERSVTNMCVWAIASITKLLQEILIWRENDKKDWSIIKFI